MSKKQPDIHDVNRLNEYEERDAWDMFLDIWTSKLGILAGSIIILAVAVLGIFLALGYWDITIVWGETEVIVVLSILAALGLGGWFIVLPMLSLDSTPFELLIKVNSTHDSILNGWIMHPVRMGKVTVEEGKAYSEIIKGIPVHFVRDYNPKTRVAEGVWRGEMNDIELETHVEAMEENRGRLRRWARIGQYLYAKLPAMAVSIENNYHNAMTDDKLQRKAKHDDVVSSEVIQSIEMLVDSMELPGEKDSEPDAEEMFNEAIENDLGEVPASQGGGDE